MYIFRVHVRCEVDMKFFFLYVAGWILIEARDLLRYSSFIYFAPMRSVAYLWLQLTTA